MTGHIHAESMAQYAEDARKVQRPWTLWEVKREGGGWVGCWTHLSWSSNCEYRRKPQVMMMKATCADGTEVEWPEPLREAPKMGTRCYFPTPGVGYLSSEWVGNSADQDFLEAGTVHASKEAAIQHEKARSALNNGSAN